jgi:poly(3-hydroxybutyrate) depolymerase
LLSATPNGHPGIIRLDVNLFRLSLLAVIFLVHGCATVTILGDFRHTSYHCSEFGDLERCFYLVTPDRQPESPISRVSHTLAPQPRSDTAILLLHPALATPGMFEWLTGFGKDAVYRGHTVVYPIGIGNSWNDGRGGRFTLSEWFGVDDFAWIRSVIRELQDHGITRLYLMGMSSGGMVAIRLFCDTRSLPDGTRLAGLITVVSNMPGQVAGTCVPVEPAPVLSIFGARDYILRGDGGEVLFFAWAFGNTLSADTTINILRNALACSDQATHQRQDQNADGQARLRTRYTDCAGNATVERVTLEDAAHSWPGEPAWTSWLTWRGWVTDEMEGNRYILEWIKAQSVNVPQNPSTPSNVDPIVFSDWR